jgi:hypothetical protein
MRKTVRLATCRRGVPCASTPYELPLRMAGSTGLDQKGSLSGKHETSESQYDEGA